MTRVTDSNLEEEPTTILPISNLKLVTSGIHYQAKCRAALYTTYDDNSKQTHTCLNAYLNFEDLNKRVNDTQLPSIWHPDATVGVMPDRQEKYNEHVSQWSRSPL